VTAFLRGWVVGLASLSALAELFGTLCVIAMYRETGATALRIEAKAIEDNENRVKDETDPKVLLAQDSVAQAGFFIQGMRRQSIEDRLVIAQPLKRRRLYDWGFAALIVGAIAGWAAAIVAVVG
jgi:hypothetical protein